VHHLQRRAASGASDISARRSARRRPGLRVTALASLVVALAAFTLPAVPAAQAAVPTPQTDPFYSYSGSTPLASIAPGTVLKTRSLPYHVVGLALPVSAVQLLYRTTGAQGQPTVNVTSVLRPPIQLGTPKVISYQSFYDSLSPDDEPSYAISGGLTIGGLIPNVESLFIAPALLAGFTVVVPDTEGEAADFAAGPEYGYDTIDSLRAALASPSTHLGGTRQIGMMGYSGGAIATEWASELAPTYAPALDKLLVGASYGGVLVDPAHNLHYISGSSLWAGVMAMALIGISRAYNINLTPYLSTYGEQVLSNLQTASIITGLFGGYSGLTFGQLTGPQYQQPESIPAYVTVANKLIMGTGGTPTTPLEIDQGANGSLDGTNNAQAGIGAGDGVMIAGDVRTLARGYCAKGVPVQYNEHPALDHLLTAVVWLGNAYAWLLGRFAGLPAPSDCSSIAPGNSLAPVTLQAG
jgi:hypothetical protein